MIIGTAGHIDHGKTLLIQALTGIETDRLKEEKDRGISIELGFAYVPVPGSASEARPAGDVLGFVDVPGHERFVHTMVAGATGISFALLVVAADDGVMPQTREHLQVLDLLGIRDGVVALNKIDLADEARIHAVEAQIRDALVGTSLEGIEIVPVSAAQGSGIDALRTRLVEEAASRPEVPVSGSFRMAIDRSFTIRGAGTVVTGAVRSGTVQVGDKVLALPCGKEVRIRSIHAQGRASETGCAGQRCALNLVGIEKAALKRGDWLVETSSDAMTDRFDAEFMLLGAEDRAIRMWNPVYLHVGTSRVRANIVMLEGERLQPGERALVQIVTARPLPLVFGDQFVVRDASAARTIGGGHVIDPRASRHRRRAPMRNALRAELRLPDHAEALDGVLSLDPAIVDLDQFVSDRGLTADEAEEIVELVEPEVFTVGGFRFAARPEALGALGESVCAELSAFHAENPEQSGMPLETLCARLEPRLPRKLFDAAIAYLVDSDLLTKEPGAARLPTHTSSMTRADQNLWSRISAVLEPRRFQPPPLHELAEAISAPITDVRKVCKMMVRMGTLVEVRKDRYFLKAALAELGTLAHKVAGESQTETFTVANFRDRAGCGRAVAVQVLEYFDRHGITGRRGDVRVVSKAPSEVFSNTRMI